MAKWKSLFDNISLAGIGFFLDNKHTYKGTAFQTVFATLRISFARRSFFPLHHYSTVMKRSIIILLFISVLLPVRADKAQSQSITDNHHPREFIFPDVPGFYTMSADLHIHTAFSDGHVLPRIRIQEAVRDRLDAISLTEHIEYLPHRDDIPLPDRNRPYEVASQLAQNEDLIIINGAEITRGMPPGHSNAIFLEDANKLVVDDVLDAYKAAAAQGAFIFWDHPSWKRQASDAIPPFSDMHREMIADGLIHGVEVVNHHRFSEEALQIALDYDLTILANTDVHGLIDWDYDTEDGGHRSATLIFAEERTKEGLKEALFDGRTVARKDHFLIGREEHLVPLLQACLVVTGSSYLPNTEVLELEITNLSSNRFILENISEYSFHLHTQVFEVEPFETMSILVKTVNVLDEISLPLRVLNAVMAPRTSPSITLERVME